MRLYVRGAFLVYFCLVLCFFLVPVSAWLHRFARQGAWGWCSAHSTCSLVLLLLLLSLTCFVSCSGYLCFMPFLLFVLFIVLCFYMLHVLRARFMSATFVLRTPGTGSVCSLSKAPNCGEITGYRIDLDFRDS